MKRIYLHFIFVSLIFQAKSQNAIDIAKWNFFGRTANYGSSPEAPNITSNSNVNIIGLTRGSGLTTSGTSASSVWGASDATETSEASAISISDFITFSFNPNTGFRMSLKEIAAHNFRISGSPGTTAFVQWQYNINGGSYTDIGSDITLVDPTSGSNGVAQAAINLSTIAALQNMNSTQTVQFRIVVWKGTAGGRIYINSNTSASPNQDFIVKGFVCKEPAYASSSVTNMMAQCFIDSFSYYGDVNGSYFAIKKASSGINGELVSISVKSSGLDTIAVSSTGAGQQHQSVLLGRSWNVTAGTQPSTPVKIRFFFPHSDTLTVINAVNNLRTAIGNSSLISSNFEWFKTISVPYDAAWRATVIGNRFPLGTYLKLFNPIYGDIGGIQYVELTVSSFSGGTGGAGFGHPGSNTGIGLPVSWAGVEVKVSELGNELTWNTASEQNSNYFEVLFSKDGVNFNAISSKIKAAGQSQVYQKYYFNHTNDYAKVSYYKIKQVDLNGKIYFSETKTAKRFYDKPFIVNLNPSNLSEDIFNLKVENIDQSALNIKIISLTGSIMYSEKFYPLTDIFKTPIHLIGLQKGVYFLQIENFQSKDVIKFVK